MLNTFRASRSNIVVWVIVALLIVGLTGFGIGVGGFASSNIASVGDREVSTESYARALDQEMRAISNQVGRTLTIEEARQFGIDRSVLARLVNDAALDGEAARLGLSTGDETVREQILTVPAFAGTDGNFSAESYSYALDRRGLTAPEFEDLLRREITRETIAASVESAVDFPQAASDTVLGFLGERRAFDWLRLDGQTLDEPVPAPTQDQLVSQHKDNPDLYTRPETRQISYAMVTPESLAARIDVPESDLRAIFDAEPDRFATPERRILDRITFGTMDEAATAKSRLDAGEIGFDALATERGLTASDIEQGNIAADDLDEAARSAVFGATGPGYAGPVETALGPSIYRINAILGGSTTSFEDARDELALERGLRLAGDRILDETAVLEDLIAGGATLEEIADETEMEQGSIALNADSTGGLADDPAFVELANEAREGEETDLISLDNGGLLTLRIESIEPSGVIALDEITDRVSADWIAAATADALQAKAGTLAGQLDGGLTFDDLSQQLKAAKQTSRLLTRGDILPGAPPELIADVFAAEADGNIIRIDGDGVIIARLTEIAPFDREAEDNTAITENIQTQFRDQAASDVLSFYTSAIRDAAGVSVNQELIDTAIARFQ